MVGIVIVSHSAQLAAGVAELARGMGGPELALSATGGLDLPDRPLGTDVMLVLRAIEEVYSDEGVVVLMDLGSALLSAEMALDLLPPERRAHVVLCEAPLVEGAVAAAVQARLGSPLAQVLAEARGALAPKAEQLRGTVAPVKTGRLPEPAAGWPDAADARPLAGALPVSELRLTVRNRFGLHARPAARFVQIAGRFPDAHVTVRNLTTGRGPVNANSINSVITLGAWQGHEILVTASGPNAQRVLDALGVLANEEFEAAPDGERGAEPAAPRVRPEAADAVAPALQGLPVSPGIAIGPIRYYLARTPKVPTGRADDPEAEWEALQAAVERTRSQLRATRDGAARRAGEPAAAIFDAHLLFLDDDALLEPARAAIFEETRNAAAAWQAAVAHVTAGYEGLDEAYLRDRAADLAGVGRQVLVNLLGGRVEAALPAAPGILVAVDLTATEAAHLDPQTVFGVCTARGGPTSHSAILTRTLGIPAVVGLGDAILGLAEGTRLVMDGETGQVWPNPPPALVRDARERAEAEQHSRAEARAASAAPAVTRDGRRIAIGANIGSILDAQSAVDFGAEGVGLFRTEFLFLGRQSAPHEDEQYQALRAAAAALNGRPIIIRTLDAGGDKPLPYLDNPAEANPFLGRRGVRLCLAEPEFFKTQLRAIVRVAAEFPVKVMFPMVATLAEWRAARCLLEDARAEIVAQGGRVPDRIETGIMVEAPAAALSAEQFAADVDFFSIGTNDLAQYALAAERGNPSLAELADPFQPAVIRLMRGVVDAAHAAGKWVGVCGEMAAEPSAAPLLVGLGVDELSMNAPAIPRIKQVIRGLDYAAVAALADEAAAAESVAAVKSILRREG